MTERWKFRVVLAMALGASWPMWAQSGAGTIQGTIQDATSASIPGASVQALNTATGVSVDTATNDGGFFALKGLLAGSYRLTISAPGMKKLESALTLQNGQVLVFNR